MGDSDLSRLYDYLHDYKDAELCVDVTGETMSEFPFRCSSQDNDDLGITYDQFMKDGPRMMSNSTMEIPWLPLDKDEVNPIAMDASAVVYDVENALESSDFVEEVPAISTIGKKRASEGQNSRKGTKNARTSEQSICSSGASILDSNEIIGDYDRAVGGTVGATDMQLTSFPPMPENRKVVQKSKVGGVRRNGSTATWTPQEQKTLTYTGALFRAMNVGDLEGLRRWVQTFVVPTCVLRTRVSNDSKRSVKSGAPDQVNVDAKPDNAGGNSSIFVNKVVPGDKIFEYFSAIGEAVPDAIWQVEDTKLRNTSPKTVVSRCRMKGTIILNENYKSLRTYASAEERERLDRATAKLSPKTKISALGTVRLELNEDLLIQNIEFVYSSETLSKPKE